jgi:hypothetical protein
MSRCLSLLVLVLGLFSHLVRAESYTVTGSIPIGGTGHWDYLMDLKTHTLYLSSAKFGPKPEGSRFPSVVPETFKVLIVKRP